MVKLNELALENVVGGENPSFADCALSSFKGGALSPFKSIHRACKYVAGYEGDFARFGGAGYLLSVAACSAAVIGAYEGGKYLYRKIKDKNNVDFSLNLCYNISVN